MMASSTNRQGCLFRSCSKHTSAASPYRNMGLALQSCLAGLSGIFDTTARLALILYSTKHDFYLAPLTIFKRSQGPSTLSAVVVNSSTPAVAWRYNRSKQRRQSCRLVSNTPLSSLWSRCRWGRQGWQPQGCHHWKRPVSYPATQCPSASQASGSPPG